MKKNYFLVIPVIICINFFLPRLMPGDPFLYLSVEDGNTAAVFSQEQIEQYEAYYGLDQPVIKQFINYMSKMVQGDLGTSIFYNSSVSKMILERIPWTILIVVVSLALSSIIGTILGIISAWHREYKFDRITYTIMLFISEIPAFLIGTLLLFFLAAHFVWFPLSGGSTVFSSYDTLWEKAFDIIHHMALPVLTLVLARIGNFYLLSRNSMMTVLTKDYMRTARGKGLKKHTILFRHALRNSLTPVMTQVFMSLGTSFGQAVLVENVFAYPGVGRLMREAVLNRDYALMQGIFLVMSMMILLMNFTSEIFLKKTDPRVV